MPLDGASLVVLKAAQLLEKLNLGVPFQKSRRGSSNLVKNSFVGITFFLLKHTKSLHNGHLLKEERLILETGQPVNGMCPPQWSCNVR